MIPTLNNTCTISGFVLDRKTKEPLIGANVVIVETSKGAATYKDGSFSINNVPPGKIRNKSQLYRVYSKSNIVFGANFRYTINVEPILDYLFSKRKSAE